MTFIKTLKDKFNNIVYPVTKEKAVYDDNGIRLDSKITTIFDKLKLKRMPDGSSFDSMLSTNKYMVFNPPYNMHGSAVSFIVDVINMNDADTPIDRIEQTATVVNSNTDNGSGVSYSRVRCNGIWTNWVRVIKSDQTTSSDTINNANIFPTSQVTYALGQEIDVINNNLVKQLLHTKWTPVALNDVITFTKSLDRYDRLDFCCFARVNGDPNTTRKFTITDYFVKGDIGFTSRFACGGVYNSSAYNCNIGISYPTTTTAKIEELSVNGYSDIVVGQIYGYVK